MKCLMLYCDVHMVGMRIELTGTISGICFGTGVTPYLLQSSDGGDDISANRPDNTSIRRDSMLARFDSLCESLGDTLHEVVIISNFDSDLDSESGSDPDTLKAHMVAPIKKMHTIHAQMPNMARRRSLVFRRLRKDLEEDDLDREEAFQSTLVRDSPYWEDVPLLVDDEQPPVV